MEVPFSGRSVRFCCCEKALRFALWKEDGRFCSWRVPFGLSAESAGDLGYLRGDEFSSTIVANLWAKRKERN